jgi:hypothetical protein
VARPNSLVDDVTGLVEPIQLRVAAPEGSAARYIEVAFAGGRTGLLDLTTYRGRVWADVLRSLREMAQPAYVEMDPKTHVITQLLQPLRSEVVRVVRVKDGFEVELVESHARHYLRKSNPQFNELRKALEAARAGKAPVLVTEILDEHEIIDVRPVAGERGAGKE